MMYLLITIVLLTMLLTMISKMLKIKWTKDREKFSPFECGFDPDHKTRSMFSLRFFMITILFLVFDVELSIMLPIPLTMSMESSTMFLMNLTIFLILLVGLLMEWSQKALTWQWVYI